MYKRQYHLATDVEPVSTPTAQPKTHHAKAKHHARHHHAKKHSGMHKKPHKRRKP